MSRQDDEAQNLEASADEVTVMNRAMSTLHGSLVQALRKLYREALGSEPEVSLSPRALLAEILDKAQPGEVQAIARAVGEERAGQRPVPRDLSRASPAERAQRLFFGLGDDFQGLLAPSLGPQRAHALRTAEGGWPWRRSIFSGCEQK